MLSVCYIGDGETQIARSSTDVVQDMASMTWASRTRSPHLDESINSARGHLAHAVSLPPLVPPDGIPRRTGLEEASSSPWTMHGNRSKNRNRNRAKPDPLSQ